MEHYGFAFDAENCIGCHTCQVACKDVHNLAVGENFRTVRTFTTGSGYTPRMYHLSLACNHCEAPACLLACPEAAFFRDELGLVLIDGERCTGCGACVDACVYGAITLLSSGVAAKCDGCLSLRRKGEAVSCVASCPQRVLEFKPIRELLSAYAGGDPVTADAAPLPPSSTTYPNLIMRVKDCMHDPDYDEIII
ncbi:MAG: 4Fe-4S dicluster domain-containing protein [Coriobacteriales bacterium]|nr:4Fe-4S dicluster domain-containing protein [Coriobacteriales bacterium]